jgi:hypothetical protein
VDDFGAAFVVLFFRGIFNGIGCAQFLYRPLPKLPPCASVLSVAINYNMYENKALVFNGG